MPRRLEPRSREHEASPRRSRGAEFLNAHVVGCARKRETPPTFSRLRPGNKNDNARVEQKNGSVARECLGYNRLDDFDLKKDLDRLCEQISLYNNLFRPSRRIISKTKKLAAHGCSKKYNALRTPLERALETGVVLPDEEKRLHARLARTNPIRLLEDIRRRLGLILHKQDRAAKKGLSL